MSVAAAGLGATAVVHAAGSGAMSVVVVAAVNVGLLEFIKGVGTQFQHLSLQPAGV